MAAAIVGINGIKITLWVESSAPGLYFKLEGQRDLTIEKARAEIDASSKDMDAEKVLAGRKTQTVSVDCVYSTRQGAPANPAYDDLLDAFNTSVPVQVRIYEDVGAGDQEVEQALMSVLDASEAHPDADVSTIAFRMKNQTDWAAPS